MSVCVRVLLLATCAVALSGCPEGVTIVPLYEGELDLCTEEMADVFAERIEACRARWELDRSCAGVTSFTGRLVGEEVTVDSDLMRLGADFAVFPDTTRALDALELYGASPYFDYRIVLSLLGGAPDVGASSRVVQIGGPSGPDEGWSTDGFARCQMRIAAPPDSEDLSMTGGEIAFSFETEDEHGGTFRFTRGTTESITGCFHVFTTVTSNDPQETK